MSIQDILDNTAKEMQELTEQTRRLLECAQHIEKEIQDATVWLETHGISPLVALKTDDCFSADMQSDTHEVKNALQTFESIMEELAHRECPESSDVIFDELIETLEKLTQKNERYHYQTCANRYEDGQNSTSNCDECSADDKSVNNDILHNDSCDAHSIHAE
jgi:hypothetical protein